jgi:hypothetical protein
VAPNIRLDVRLGKLFPSFLEKCLDVQIKSRCGSKKTAAASTYLLHHRLVPSSPADIASVKRGGELNLYVEVLVKLVLSSRFRVC